MYLEYGINHGEFNTPRGIALNSTHILVADTGNDRIQIFDQSGVYQSQFGSLGSGDDEFTNPFGIALDSTHILVADTNNDRIQIFDQSGNYVNKITGVECVDNQTVVNGVCIDQAPESTCTGNQTVVNGVCVDPTCVGNQTLDNGVCIELESKQTTRTSGGGSDKTLDPRVCGGVLCSDVKTTIKTPEPENIFDMITNWFYSLFR